MLFARYGIGWLGKDLIVPSAPVRAIAFFAGPIPPKLTAATFMTYMVKAVRFVSVVLFDATFTFTKLISRFKSSGK